MLTVHRKIQATYCLVRTTFLKLINLRILKIFRNKLDKIDEERVMHSDTKLSDSRKLTEKGISLWKPEKKSSAFLVREASSPKCL